MSHAESSQALDDPTTRRIAALALVSVGVVWMLMALAYRDSTVIADTARDVVAAARILLDGNFPAAGPSSYGTWS